MLALFYLHTVLHKFSPPYFMFCFVFLPLGPSVLCVFFSFLLAPARILILFSYVACYGIFPGGGRVFGELHVQ